MSFLIKAHHWLSKSMKSALKNLFFQSSYGLEYGPFACLLNFLRQHKALQCENYENITIILTIFQLNLPVMSSEVSREELHGMSMAGSVIGGGDSSSGGGASPLTARSMRLERVAQALAHSQEELRR